MMRLLKRLTLAMAVPTALALPVAAEAQNNVNPYMPMTTKPSGAPNPGIVNPGDPINEGNMNGVISPPPVDRGMPVIHPQTQSQMPVIPPAGTPGGNPTVIPK